MFLDKVKITIKSGNGGKGCISFYRSKQTANGGPDGGNGGAGGNVLFRATNSQNTLYNFKFKKIFIAENGEAGSGQNKSGKNGKDIIIDVPCGTVIIDNITGNAIADLQRDGDVFTAQKGGLGGRGNAFFATATRQAPRFSQLGEVTEQHEVILELKTIADVGLVGYPNVGKSTLLSVISNARPKIADYAFTTIEPNLGVVQYYDNSFVVADIPGLIEGSSDGVGLGHEFLKHIERVRLILHLIDFAEVEGRNAVNDFVVINKELKKYSEKLFNLKQIIVLTKCDLISKSQFNEKLKKFTNSINKLKKEFMFLGKEPIIIPISSISNLNLDLLKNMIWTQLQQIPKPNPIEIIQSNFDVKDKTSLIIERKDNGVFVVSGGYVDNLSRGVVLSDFNSFSYFQLRLKKDGVIDKLKQKGLKTGDTVKFKDIEFIWEE